MKEKLKVEQIPTETLKALKLSGKGKIVYRLWVDDEGCLYVQMEGNTISSPTPGTFSGLLFSVSEYAASRNDTIVHPRGYDLKENSFQESRNNNDGPFLKAVLRHLLPESEQA